MQDCDLCLRSRWTVLARAAVASHGNAWELTCAAWLSPWPNPFARSPPFGRHCATHKGEQYPRSGLTHSTINSPAHASEAMYQDARRGLLSRAVNDLNGWLKVLAEIHMRLILHGEVHVLEPALRMPRPQGRHWSEREGQQNPMSAPAQTPSPHPVRVSPQRARQGLMVQLSQVDTSLGQAGKDSPLTMRVMPDFLSNSRSNAARLPLKNRKPGSTSLRSDIASDQRSHAHQPNFSTRCPNPRLSP